MFQPFFFFLLFQGVILTVPADTFVSQLTKTTILIDVRTPEEFDEGQLTPVSPSSGTCEVPRVGGTTLRHR